MIGYKEIFEILRKEILAGKYDDERTMPSEFALAKRFKCCRPTVSHAMQELSVAGLVIRRKGAATRLTRFAQNATGVFGLLVQGEYNYCDLFPEICRRLVARSECVGWKVLRRSIPSCNKKDRKLHIKKIVGEFISSHVTGVFFQPVEGICDSERFNREIISRLDDAGIRTVLLDYDIVSSPGRSEYDIVCVDNFAGGYEIGLHFMSRGAKRIAFAIPRFPAQTSFGRLRGLSQSMIEHGLTWNNSSNIVTVDPFIPANFRTFIRNFRPDAIAVYNDAAAIRIVHALEECRLSVPADIMVAGFDDISSAAENSLTTVRQPVDSIVETAFQTMITRLKIPQLPPRKVELACKLVVRASTAGRR